MKKNKKATSGILSAPLEISPVIFLWAKKIMTRVNT
jgi:hypothetical protein